jgi:alpha-beta hydrolase superfamily lysophospholipase
MTTLRSVAVALLLVASACAAPAYVAGKRVPPTVPDDVAHRESYLNGKDGVMLLTQSWLPKSGEPKAVVVLVHGLKDYSDRYGDFAHALTQHGYAVYAYDQRGHGDSAGDRVWVGQFDDYLDDLGAFVERVRQEQPGKPFFLFGHSMGGAVVTLYTIRKQPDANGLVLSAAALKIDANGLLRGSVHLFSTIAPSLAVFELKDEDFSRDKAVVDSMKHDPLIYDGSGPARTAGEVLNAIGEIRERSQELKVPVLAMHGTLDKVTPPSGDDDLVAKASSTDKTAKKYDGLVHDLLHEPEKDQVVADVVAWLDAHLKAP